MVRPSVSRLLRLVSHWCSAGSRHCLASAVSAVDGPISSNACRPRLPTVRMPASKLTVGKPDEFAWTLTRTPEGPALVREAGTADVVVRAGANELLLLVKGRFAPTRRGIEVTGDAALLDHWLAHSKS